jgi:hypothetical protein
MQAVSVFAILVSGFIMALSTSSQRLNAFHWSIIVLLTWFCAITYLAGLTSLRTYLSRRTWVKAMRFAIMTALLALFVVASIPTGFFNWTHSFYEGAQWNSVAAQNSPAACFFSLERGLLYWQWYQSHGVAELRVSILNTDAMQSMITGNVFLLVNFFSRSFKLYRQLSKIMAKYVRKPLHALAVQSMQAISHLPSSRQQWHVPTYLWKELVVVPLASLFLVVRFQVDLVDSMFFEVRE